MTRGLIATKKLTFLLIYPEVTRSKYSFNGIIEDECHEVEYIQAMLNEQGHRSFIFDGQIEKGTVKQALETHDPDVVFLYGKTRQESYILEYCTAAKRHDPRTVTIIGGIHAQLAPERMFCDDVDYILTTFDIYKIFDIIEMEYGEKTVLPENVDGLCYQSQTGWHRNPSKPFDINRLPLPDRSYFDAHPNNYPFLELKHTAWVRTAFCCPYRCKFCVRNRMNLGKYSKRDIKSVVDEIETISTDNIYIVDDDFLVDERRVQSFIDEIRRRGIKKNFICYGRSDFIATHESLMKEFKEIGLYYVLVGLEAFDDKYLKNYNKRSSVENNALSVEICNRLGINIMGLFILDLDYTGKDFRALYRWIKKHELVHTAVSIFVPEMGLETYEQYKDRLITDNTELYDYLHLVVKPEKIGVRRYYFHYYILLIRLFIKAQKDGIYSFLDYKKYIKMFFRDLLKPSKYKQE